LLTTNIKTFAASRHFNSSSWETKNNPRITALIKGAINQLHYLHDAFFAFEMSTPGLLVTEVIEIHFTSFSLINYNEPLFEKSYDFHAATSEELLTLNTEIEACLNSRSFIINSEDPFNPS
jgi:hypothetical protein